MSNLLAALANGGNALRQFEKAVSLTQSDVVNASTPGYAAQQLRFEATPFAPESGLYGGVQVAAIESTRDDFAESAVRRQTTQQGFFTQTAQTLSSIESAFDLGSQGGLADSMQSLFNSFSAWSQQPNDANSRNAVISAADSVAVAFRQSAAQIQDTTTAAIRQAQTLGAKINDIGQQLSEINRALRQSGDSASVEAEVYSKLEDLSQITSFTVTRASDNTLTVLLSGQVPLVVGDHGYQIQVSARNVATAGSPPAIQITDASQQDVTGIMTSGQLGGLVRCVNQDVGSLLGDDTQAGSLNTLATAFASRINALLQQGTLADGTTPGVPLFDVASDGSAAATLRIANITPDQLAAADPGPPPAVSGIALKLAGLASPSSAADKVSGSSYLDYYGQIESSVGNAVTDAKTNQTRYTELASQARSLRSEISGVSLDEEAVRLVEFQRAYEAAARTVTTLNQMMDTLMQMGQ